LRVYRDPWSSFVFSPVIVPVKELVPCFLFLYLGCFLCRAIGLSVAWTPMVTSSTKIVRAISSIGNERKRLRNQKKKKGSVSGMVDK